MENDRSTYALNAGQFEQALAILQREQQANTPSPRQEKIFKLLNRAIYGLGIAGGIVVLSSLLALAMQGMELFVLIVIFTVFILGIPSFILSVVILILFFLNLSFVRQLLRQNKLVRMLGLKEALRAPWKAERRKKRLRNLWALGVRIPGALLMLFVAGIAAAFFVEEYWRNETMETTMINKDVVLFLCVVLPLATASAAIIASYFVWRSKERLEVISRLHSSLEEHKAKAEQDEDSRVSIPAKLYEKIAQIERAQISRERIQSIMGSLEEPGDSPYVLQKSHAAQQAQARLDTAARLRVQDRIDALMTEPRPPDVTEDPKAGILHLRVPETPVIIGFTVDDQTRRIQIISVESTSDDALSPSDPGR